jgi:hypothetical protein
MSESIGTTQKKTGPGRVIPALGTLIIVGLAIYASQASVQPVQQAKEDQGSGQTTRAVAAANKFLKSLDDKQRDKALLDFDSAKKAGWSNLPVTMVARNGVRLGDLSKAQRGAAMDLLAAILSKEGYQKMIDIMNGDEMLATGRGGKGKGPKSMFGNKLYYLAIFGKPSATKPWLVQFGGHHLGLNVTIVGKSFVLTPTHTGTQPDLFTWEGKKVRPLGPENDRAFKLINALDEKQQAQAILGKNPRNLILGPGQDGKKIKPQGIKGSALTTSQQGMLLELIAAWVNILNDDAAAPRLAEIKTALPDTYFAWSGPTTNGSAAYFRVQGPTVVIEYSPQGSTSHIHTIIRDPSNDYGEKLIKQ